jgi:hypothetical protein
MLSCCMNNANKTAILLMTHTCSYVHVIGSEKTDTLAKKDTLITQTKIRNTFNKIAPGDRQQDHRRYPGNFRLLTHLTDQGARLLHTSICFLNMNVLRKFCITQEFFPAITEHSVINKTIWTNTVCLKALVYL